MFNLFLTNVDEMSFNNQIFILVYIAVILGLFAAYCTYTAITFVIYYELEKKKKVLERKSKIKFLIVEIISLILILTFFVNPFHYAASTGMLIIALLIIVIVSVLINSFNMMLFNKKKKSE